MTGSAVSDARRGDLWATDLGEPVGHEPGWVRPALVLSADGWNASAQKVTVLPLTRTRLGYPTRVELQATPGNGLDDVSYVCCEDVRTVSSARLVRRSGSVDGLALLDVERVVRRFLGL